jgi:relaxase/mobilisation protein
MAITKIHPIKSTLHLAIAYITDENKTDEKILVSTHKCHEASAHTQFLRTRENAGTKGTVLARHLIQSFLPGEATPETAHQIGIDLCKKILKDEYEYVISTHIDRGHIHNHIIFNNVNMTTGKCYQSNKKSYHQIRYQSDKLCKEQGLSVIDEYYEAYRRKYKTKGKSWFENTQASQGKSWKSKLQFDIDRTIRRAKDWDDFLEQMKKLDYEIKFGKHIAFRHKDKERFVRAYRISDDYTEERLKERITEKQSERVYPVKKRIGSVIDISKNEKAQSSKGYETWARKHNLKTVAESIILMRDKGIESVSDIDTLIKESAEKRQNIQDEIKKIEAEIQHLSETMENIHTVLLYREHSKYHRENPEDKAFAGEYSGQIAMHKKAVEEIKKHYFTPPKSKDILAKLEALQEKKNTLMDEYSSAKTDMDELFRIRKNYETYVGKEVER